MYYEQYKKPSSPPLSPSSNIHTNLTKSNSFQRHSSLRKNVLSQQQQQQQQQINTLPPIPTHLLSRGNSIHSTMTPIFEQQQQQQQGQYKLNNRVKITLQPPTHPPSSSNNQIHTRKKPQFRKNNISYTMEDDIPLALLAYKKGYTTIYPSSDSIDSTQQRNRINSYLSNSSSGSSSNQSLPHITKPSKGTQQEEKDRHRSSTKKILNDTPQPTKKKKRSESTNKRQKQKHSNITLITPPSSPPPPSKELLPVIKKEKKWYTSLRTFIRNK